MSDSTCARGFEADAIIDQRLAGADRASFERHAATCPSCARRVRMLARVQSLGNELPEPATTELERRRMRSTLLRKANEQTVQQPEPRRRYVALTVAALVAIGIALPFVLARRTAPQPTAPVATAPAIRVPTYRLESSPGSTWDVIEKTTTLRLGIRSGRFDVGVDPLAADQRFLLDLPDGELEVKGTQFRVEVREGRTRRVSVSEGRVALRLRDREPLLLGANEAWNEPVAPATPPASTAPARRSTPPAASSAPAPTAGQDFGKAMGAFNAGDYGSAEQLFVAFESAHPRDQRVEDSMFLRAVARSRRGDRAGASQLAAQYLQRYPKGLRRFEAEELRGH
jgi:ferric-dicitrate binding protein FerR (iron transport regulator)